MVIPSSAECSTVLPSAPTRRCAARVRGSVSHHPASHVILIATTQAKRAVSPHARDTNYENTHHPEPHACHRLPFGSLWPAGYIAQPPPPHITQPLSHYSRNGGQIPSNQRGFSHAALRSRSCTMHVRSRWVRVHRRRCGVAGVADLDDPDRDLDPDFGAGGEVPAVEVFTVRVE